MITDEKLSAFLDAELSEDEMEFIRGQLVDDENLANRLADLAVVDELVSLSYSAIDAHPIPQSINAILADDEPKVSNLIAFPRLKKLQDIVHHHAAIAAGVALVFGFGLSQFLQKDSSVGEWQAVAQILETSPSGIEQFADDGVYVKPRITFFDKSNDYCRQFIMTKDDRVTDNIACRKDDKWQLAATVYVSDKIYPDTYQAASGGSLLDATVEQMASGDFLDVQAESSALDSRWSTKK